jgi:hypothetical protein
VCGRTTCDPATDLCCIARTGAASCTTAAMCTGQPLTCSGGESCAAGDICCGARQTGGGLKTSCAASCTTGDVQLCSQNADCSSGTCRPTGLGYGTCAAGLPRDAGRG